MAKRRSQTTGRKRQREREKQEKRRDKAERRIARKEAAKSAREGEGGEASSAPDVAHDADAEGIDSPLHEGTAESGPSGGRASREGSDG